MSFIFLDPKIIIIGSFELKEYYINSSVYFYEQLVFLECSVSAGYKCNHFISLDRDYLVK
jgi:hypothetical protein